MTLTDSAPKESEYGDATESDLLVTIAACAKEAREARRDWLKEAKECYDFVAGHQWTAPELEALKEQRRPPVVFNRIEPVINVVAGLEVTNRQEVRYLPRELGDAGPNEVLTGAAQWARDECNAEDEAAHAFLDMAICGEGWTNTRLDYEYDQDGLIDTARTDPLEMLPDPGSLKKNYKDAEYFIREQMVALRWLKETWEEKADELEAVTQSETDQEFAGESHHNVTGDQYRSGEGGEPRRSSKKLIKLTEYQYKKRIPFYRIENPEGGDPIEASPEQHEQIQAKAEGMLGRRLKSVRQTKCVHYRAFSAGNVLLENNECPAPTSFTYKAMTAKRDKTKRCWYGLVRGMLDPQRWANKFFSQSMFILNTNAKGGVMIENDAVDDMKKFEASWAHPDKPTVVNSGAIVAGKIREKVPPPFPPELAKLLDFSIQSIYQVSGVSPEMLGAVDREQAAVLEYQRKQAGVTILATLFDALRKYRKEQGKTLLYLIQTYLSDGRLVRIVGDQGAKYVPLTKNPGTAKYDVVIDESPSSPNQKEKTWAILQTLLPMLLKAGIPIPPEALDYLPLPQSFIDAMKKPDPQKQQEQQMQKQLQQRGAVAEVSKTEAEANLANARAQAEGQGNQAEMAKVQQQGQVETAKLQQQGQLKREELGMEAALARMELMQEFALKQQAVQLDAKLEQWKAGIQADLQERTARHDAAVKDRTADAQVKIAAKKASAKPKAKAA